MNHKNTLLIGGGALLAAAVVAIFWSSNPKAPASPPDSGKAEMSADHRRPRATPTIITGQPEGDGAQAGSELDGKLSPEQQAAVQKERRAAFDILDEASTTYDAAQLPVIDKYLYHKDPAIRKAAKDAMIVLGDSGAGKLLRDAAEAANSEEEKKAMLAAADYAELPPVDPKDKASLLKNASVPSHERRRPNRNKGLGTMKERSSDASSVPSPAPAPAPAPGQ